MSKVLRIDTVKDYCDFVGVKSLHEHVGVINFADVKSMHHARKLYDIYAVFLKDAPCGKMQYGDIEADFTEGTMIFVAPGQVFGGTNESDEFKPEGYLLMFDSEILGDKVCSNASKKYSFFSYEAFEALHLDHDERSLVIRCLKEIKKEIEAPHDPFTNDIIAGHICLFLDYCARFYEKKNSKKMLRRNGIIMSMERIMEEYFSYGKASQYGIPSVQYCASQMGFTASYLGELFKRETGITVLTYIHMNMVGRAKYLLASSHMSIGEISSHLGFSYSQHFTRLFTRYVRCTPKVYRKKMQ